MIIYAVVNKEQTKLYGAYDNLELARSKTGWGASDAIILEFARTESEPIDPDGD